MQHEIQDERYSVADEAIYDAFFLILKEKDLEKITVSDVIKKAGIVRSTFYNHYENIRLLCLPLRTRLSTISFPSWKPFIRRMIMIYVNRSSWQSVTTQ